MRSLPRCAYEGARRRPATFRTGHLEPSSSRKPHGNPAEAGTAPRCRSHTRSQPSSERSRQTIGRCSDTIARSIFFSHSAKALEMLHTNLPSNGQIQILAMFGPSPRRAPHRFLACASAIALHASGFLPPDFFLGSLNPLPRSRTVPPSLRRFRILTVVTSRSLRLCPVARKRFL